MNLADGEHKEDWMEEELGWLDIDLLRKSKQHNLTSNNVRAILHVSVSISDQHTQGGVYKMCVSILRR